MPRHTVRQSSLALPLRSTRFTLREFVPADEGFVSQFLCDAAVIKYLFHVEKAADEAARTYLERVLGYQREKPRTAWELAVEDTATRELIGACNLTLTAPNEGDLGYMLRRSAWGQGYATEITQLLIDTGFEQLRLERVIATVDVRNKASINVLEKNGFRWEATFRKLKRLRGEWRDCHLYAIPRAEWEN